MGQILANTRSDKFDCAYNLQEFLIPVHNDSRQRYARELQKFHLFHHDTFNTLYFNFFRKPSRSIFTDFRKNNINIFSHRDPFLRV